MLFLAAAVLAGCASVRLKQPEVSLSGVDIKEFGLFEQRLGLALRVVNPNDNDLAIDGVEFEVEVNGQGFAKGVSNKATTVPRLGEATLDLTAVTTLGGLLKQLGELAKGGRDAVEYRIRGRLHANGWRDIPFDSRRELKIPRWLSPPPGDRPARPSAAGERT
jgi:LEA14-like dessication related protein